MSFTDKKAHQIASIETAQTVWTEFSFFSPHDFDRETDHPPLISQRLLGYNRA
jgi:hypothetical protein